MRGEKAKGSDDPALVITFLITHENKTRQGRVRDEIKVVRKANSRMRVERKEKLIRIGNLQAVKSISNKEVIEVTMHIALELPCPGEGLQFKKDIIIIIILI